MTGAAQRKAVAKPPGRLPVGAPVLWTGLALGTFLAVLALTHGVMLPGLNGFLAAVLTFALILAAGVALVELTRRHHRTVARHGWRYGKRGGGAAVGWSRRAARGAAVRSRPWRTRILTAMQARWAARTAEPLLFRRRTASTDEPGGDGTGNAEVKGGEGRQGSGEADGPTYSWGPAAGPSGWPADDAETAHRWAQHMSTGGKPYVVTEYPPGGGPGRTIATYINGTTSTEGASSMPASPSRIKTEHRARRAAARSGGSVPSEWGPVIAQTADFEPEDDGELLEWMSRQVTGLSAWAEALVDFYDHATNTIGIDPTGLGHAP